MTTEESKDKKLKLSSSKLTLKTTGKVKLPSSGFPSGRDGRITVEVKRRRRSSGKESEIPENNADIENENNLEDLGLTQSELNNRINLIKKSEESKELKKQEDLLRKQEKADSAEDVADDDALDEIKPEDPLKTEDSGLNEYLDPDFPLEENASKSKGKSAVSNDSEKEDVKRVPPKVAENKRRSGGRITLSKVLYEEERVRSFASIKRSREKAKRSKDDDTKQSKRVREVVVPAIITVQNLSNRMAERVNDVVKSLGKMGIKTSAESKIEGDVAEILVSEFGHKPIRVNDSSIENLLLVDDVKDTEENMQPRPLIVTLMGHVDHGKTSLLDIIRSSDVADHEKGGITQHIGAYQITTKAGKKITFLDTPGHEAFTEMRKRGAVATDVVILVVAADDGIMEQTREAINHAKAAKVPIVVAINKIDKPAADIKKVKSSLLDCEMVLEEFGGDVLSVGVSAKENMNIDKLLDTLLLQAEMMEIKANPNRKAFGVIIESLVDKKKGPVSTVLVKKGTLKIGNILVAGNSWGKVRAMTDSEGNRVQEAPPSFPVSITGLNGVPDAGSKVSVVDIEKEARDICTYRMNLSKNIKIAKEKRTSIDEFFDKLSENKISEFPIIIKADTNGSLEAIVSGLEKIGTNEVSVQFLHKGVGGITSSDVILAKASDALVIGFNVRAENKAKELSVSEKLDIKLYSVIYDLINDMKAFLSGLLKPAIKENYNGTAEVRDVFGLSKGYKVAGCYVRDGVIKKSSSVRLIRDNIVIYQGKLKSLRRFKNDVKEVNNNYECGIAFENYEDIKIGDMIEAFEFIEEKRFL